MQVPNRASYVRPGRIRTAPRGVEELPRHGFYALQGDHSKAIELLQLAIARGDELVSYFRRNRRLATLRDDPRFQSILKSVEARRK